MAEKKNQKEYLTYKGKPLIRSGNVIYYGNFTDKYIITMTINETRKVRGLDVATSVLISLQTNDKPGKSKVVKKAEREGLCKALDIAEFWLQDALNG